MCPHGPWSCGPSRAQQGLAFLEEEDGQGPRGPNIMPRVPAPSPRASLTGTYGSAEGPGSVAASALTSPPVPRPCDHSLSQPAPRPGPPRGGGRPCHGGASPGALLAACGRWAGPACEESVPSLRHQLRNQLADTGPQGAGQRLPCAHSRCFKHLTHAVYAGGGWCGARPGLEAALLGTAARSQVPATAPPRASVSSFARGEGEEGLGPSVSHPAPRWPSGR